MAERFVRSDFAPDLGDVDFAARLIARRARFQSVRPDLGADANDPMGVLLEDGAYWDVVTTEAFRGALVKSYWPFSTGSQLEAIARQKGLELVAGETDTALSARIGREGGLGLALGSTQRVIADAFAADDRVIDASAVWAQNGQDATVYVRSSEEPAMGELAGAPSAELVAAVTAYLADDFRHLADHIYTGAAPTLTAQTYELDVVYIESVSDAETVETASLTEMFKFIDANDHLGAGMTIYEIGRAAGSSTPPTENHPGDTSVLDAAVVSVTVSTPNGDIASATDTAYVTTKDDTDVVLNLSVA